LDSINKRDITQYLNDFNFIYKSPGKKLQFDDYNDLHMNSLDWLKYQLNTMNENNNKNYVVLTHHLPSNKLVNSQYKNDTINTAFCTNLDDLISGKLWTAGHTHIPISMMINKTPVVVNPFGYVRECDYSKMKEIEIEFEFFN
jgi:Icc-related predicted phosphoesterase